MNKVLCKLLVSMAGFLNGGQANAQLPDMTFPAAISSRFQHGMGINRMCVCVCVCVCRMHITYSLHLLCPCFSPRNSKTRIFTPKYEFSFVIHMVICFT